MIFTNCPQYYRGNGSYSTTQLSLEQVKRLLNSFKRRKLAQTKYFIEYQNQEIEKVERQFPQFPHMDILREQKEENSKYLEDLNNFLVFILKGKEEIITDTNSYFEQIEILEKHLWDFQARYSIEKILHHTGFLTE